jgi:CRP/FNR family cyclic AMP-dependent transcriptional regulator
MLNQSVQIRTALERALNTSIWPEAAVKKLFRQVEVRSFQDGERALAEGGHVDAVWIVLSGAFVLSRMWKNDRRFLYGILKTGEITGIKPVFDGLPAAFDVIARGDATILAIAGKTIREIAASYPPVALEIISYLCRQGRVDYDALEIHSMSSVRHRIANCILWLARDEAEAAGGEVAIDSKFSQEDIADMIGAARQSVNKELRQLIKKGIIRQHYRALVILDRDRLMRVAAEDESPSRNARTKAKSKKGVGASHKNGVHSH